MIMYLQPHLSHPDFNMQPEEVYFNARGVCINNRYHVKVTLDPHLPKGTLQHQAKPDEFGNTPTGGKFNEPWYVLLCVVTYCLQSDFFCFYLQCLTILSRCFSAHYFRGMHGRFCHRIGLKPCSNTQIFSRALFCIPVPF